MPFGAPRISQFAGYAAIYGDMSLSASGRLVTWLIVGSVRDVMADAPGPLWDRRLVLPFALEVAAA
jgi:hypothetical protein